MRDYAEQVKALRYCGDCDRQGCAKECKYGKEHPLNFRCIGFLFADAADAIEELLDELTTIRKQLSHWISVEERLPEDGEFVLVCNDDGHMMIAKHESEVYEWYYKYTNYDFDIWDNEEQGPVLWWMPLPTPPKGVE